VSDHGRDFRGQILLLIVHIGEQLTHRLTGICDVFQILSYNSLACFTLETDLTVLYRVMLCRSSLTVLFVNFLHIFIFAVRGGMT